MVKTHMYTILYILEVIIVVIFFILYNRRINIISCDRCGKKNKNIKIGEFWVCSCGYENIPISWIMLSTHEETFKKVEEARAALKKTEDNK